MEIFMAYWCSCGDKISKKRYKAGYIDCKNCGEEKAQEEIKRRSKGIMNLHKSNLVPVRTRQDVLDISRMRR